MIYDDASQAAPAILERIAAANRILILTHVNPDGDAIGSLLGVWHLLRSYGKHAIPLASSPIPDYAAWLPGAEQISIYQHDMALPEVDLVIMVDTASMSRIGRIYDDHAEALLSLPIIIIDHHATNDGLGTLNFIQPAAASTSELLYELFEAMDAHITPDLATCLLLGLTTDTQSFQTTATVPNSFRAAAALVEAGANQARVVHEVYNALPASTARLVGMALSTLQTDGLIAWTAVTQSMLEAAGAADEAAEEVVRFMQRIAGLRALVLFKERYDGTTKISLRSIPPFNVGTLAQTWGGGGHAQAAGATLLMGPEQAAHEVLPRLRQLVQDHSA